jgi:hypothetical protein
MDAELYINKKIKRRNLKGFSRRNYYGSTA